jgi:hypothetical protein
MDVLEHNALRTPGGTRLQTQAPIAAIIQTSLIQMMSPILETCLFTLLQVIRRLPTPNNNNRNNRSTNDVYRNSADNFYLVTCASPFLCK